MPWPWDDDTLKDDQDNSGYFHRLVIGVLGGALPFLLMVINYCRPLKDLSLNSLSAYYYSGAVAAFAGVLFALTVYFFTYQGYKNERKGWDCLAL